MTRYRHSYRLCHDDCHPGLHETATKLLAAEPHVGWCATRLDDRRSTTDPGLWIDGQTSCITRVRTYLPDEQTPNVWVGTRVLPHEMMARRLDNHNPGRPRKPIAWGSRINK